MGEWKQGICGCFSNLTLSCFAVCLHPLAIGKTADYVGEKHPVLWALAGAMCPCFAHGLIREMVRKKHDIEGSFANDCCAYCLCAPCAMVQTTVESGVMDYLAPKEQKMQRVAPEQ